ncbi:MAG: transglutaminase family protein [Sphingomonadales bacterium]|nr:transglutaminase family protein [Sphingomonadales bacterium]MBD3774151.1 transglutaminase family protein [Paracoccaceae bacterium]
MIYRVSHEIRMRYAKPVADARFNLRLKPVEWPGQAMSDYRLDILPQPAVRADETGPYYLTTTRLEYEADVAELAVSSSFTMAVEPRGHPGPTPAVGELRQLALEVPDLSVLSPAPYLFASRIAAANREIGEWAAQLCPPDTAVLDAALALADRLHGEFTYQPGATDSGTAPIEAFRARNGVCQDFAHVMIMGLRWCGIPAAYASGYLRTIPPPGQEKLVGADAMHAWVTVWCGEQAGWVGIDPTNNCLASGDHILIAMGRDYADVAPIDGTFVGAAPQIMSGGVDVAVIDPA